MKFVLKKIELNKNKKLLLLLLLSIQNWKLIQKGNIFFLKFIVYETYFLFSFFFFKNLKRDRNLIDNFVSSCLEDWTSQKNPPIKFNLISIHCILFLFFFFFYTKYRITETKMSRDIFSRIYIRCLSKPVPSDLDSPSPMINKYYPPLLGPKCYSRIL